MWLWIGARRITLSPVPGAHDLCLRLRAYDAVDLPAAFMTSNMGMLWTLKRCVVADSRRCSASRRDAAAHFLRQSSKPARHPTRSAPGSPQVDQSATWIAPPQRQIWHRYCQRLAECLVVALHFHTPAGALIEAFPWASIHRPAGIATD